jgi:ABC-type transport system involved in multi-copper enzyme maturation permease subunit
MSTDAVPAFGPRALRPYRPLQGFWPAFTWGLRLALGKTRRILIVGVLGTLVGYLVGSRGMSTSRAARMGFTDAAFDLWGDLDASLLRYVVPLVALVMVAGAFQREVTDRTLVFHLVRPISRRTLFLARFLAGVVVAIPVAVVPVASAVFFSGVPLPPEIWAGVVLAVALGVVSTGAIYYLLAAWLRFGTIAGLVYTFVIDSFVQGASGSMQKLSATFYVRSVLHDLTDAHFVAQSKQVARAVAGKKSVLEQADEALRGGSVIPDAERIPWLATGDALVVLGVLTAVLLALGLWIVSRRDYSLKE